MVDVASLSGGLEIKNYITSRNVCFLPRVTDLYFCEKGLFRFLTSLYFIFFTSINRWTFSSRLSQYQAENHLICLFRASRKDSRGLGALFVSTLRRPQRMCKSRRTCHQRIVALHPNNAQADAIRSILYARGPDSAILSEGENMMKSRTAEGRKRMGIKMSAEESGCLGRSANKRHFAAMSQLLHKCFSDTFSPLGKCILNPYHTGVFLHTHYHWPPLWHWPWQSGHGCRVT